MKTMSFPGFSSWACSALDLQYFISSKACPSAALPYYRSSVQRMTQKSACPSDPGNGVAAEFISALPAQDGKFSAATTPTPPGKPGSSQHTYIHRGRLLPGEAVTETLIIHQVWLLAAHGTEEISNSRRPEPHDKVPALSRAQGPSPMQLAATVQDTVSHHVIHFQGLRQGCRCLRMGVVQAGALTPARARPGGSHSPGRSPQSIGHPL